MKNDYLEQVCIEAILFMFARCNRKVKTVALHGNDIKWTYNRTSSWQRQIRHNNHSILVGLYTDWCGWCKMDENAFIKMVEL